MDPVNVVDIYNIAVVNAHKWEVEDRFKMLQRLERGNHFAILQMNVRGIIVSLQITDLVRRNKPVIAIGLNAKH